MLRSIKKLLYQDALGITGIIGSVDTIYFDMGDWNIRVFGIIDKKNDGNNEGPKAGPSMLLFDGEANGVTWDKKGLFFHSEKPLHVAEEQTHSLICSTDVLGSKLISVDGNPGYIDDLAVDEFTWKIQYLIFISYPRFGGRRIMLPPSSIVSISPETKIIEADLTTNTIFDIFSEE